MSPQAAPSAQGGQFLDKYVNTSKLWRQAITELFDPALRGAIWLLNMIIMISMLIVRLDYLDYHDYHKKHIDN